MLRRGFLGSALAVASALAGCSSAESTTGTRTRTGGPTPTTATYDGTETQTARPTAAPTETTTRTPTPTERSFDPFRSWLVSPTPVDSAVYEFTALSLSGIRADANATFADQVDAYWRRRDEGDFGIDLPVSAVTDVLTVNHSRIATEDFRVAGGSFDVAALRDSLGPVDAEEWVDDVLVVRRTEDGRPRALGLHPDVVVSVGAGDVTEDLVSQVLAGRRRDRQRYRVHEGLATLLDRLGTTDFVAGAELVPETDPNFPLSEAVATGRTVDVGETTSRQTRVDVFRPDAVLDPDAIREEIRQRHVGQPLDEFSVEGRVATAAGAVENSLVRLL